MTEPEQWKERCSVLTTLLGDALKRGYISPHRITAQWLRGAQQAVADAEQALGRTVVNRPTWTTQRERPERPEEMGRMPI